MDFSEFRRRLAADPRTLDPELRAARGDGVEFEQAALEAEALDRLLSAALEVPVPEGLLDEIAAIPGQATRRLRPGGWALAASLVLAVGAVTLWWQNRMPGALPDYVAQHYAHDGPRLAALAAGQNGPVTADDVMAEFGVRLSGALAGQVRLAKFCPTPDGRGAHLVLETPDGPVQLIYIPGAHTPGSGDIRFDGMHARLLALGPATAALIAAADQSFDNTEALVRNAITPLTAET